MKATGAELASSQRRVCTGRAVVAAMFLFLDAAFLLAVTVLAVWIIGTLCIFTCEPLTADGVRTMVEIGILGAGLVAVHGTVGVRLLGGRRVARSAGIAVGVLWTGVSVVALQSADPKSGGIGLAWAAAFLGLTTLVSCLAARPRRAGG